MRYLILGSGPAGIAAAKAVRNVEKDAEVILATEEFFPPYLRPCIPDIISGEMEPTAIADPQGKNLAAEKIEVRHGKRARRVAAEKKRVIFSEGTEETYNFLLIATGGRPILPLALMGNVGAFLLLNSFGDALRIRARAMRADVTVVYGPGYLGIEAARALRQLGQQVIWVSPGLPRFGNPISGEVEARITEQLRNNGVQIKEGTDITDVLDLDGKTYIICTAGDCAEVFDINRRESRINFGWRSALKQGQLAGENLAGGGKLYIRNTEDYFGLLYGSPLLERVK